MNILMRRPIVAALFLATLLFSSCEKEEVERVGLPQEGDILGVTVTEVPITARTVPGDSTRTSLSQATVLLGEINDPTFGRARSIFHTQIRPSATGDIFGEGVVCDSIVLSLEYISDDSLFGSPTSPLLFSVFQLAEDLAPDSNYLSNRLFNTTGPDLMEVGSSIKTLSGYPTVISGDTVPSQLRLRLDPIHAALFTEIPSIDEFIESFKGVQVVADAGGAPGGIGKFDANDSATKLTVYYQNDVADSLSVDFFINTFAQRNLYFDLEPGADIQAQFDDPSLGGQDLYIQSMTGANVEITIDTTILDKNTMAINKAEIVLTSVAAMPNEMTPEPSRIFGIFADEDGSLNSIPDVVLGEVHADGNFNENTLEYRVNVTSYLQRVLTGEINTNKLRLLPVSNSASADFVHLYGPEAAVSPAKLIVTYTKF